MSQMKEQNKTLKNELNKMETSNLLDTEFKILIGMLNKLKGRVDEFRTSTEIRNIKIEIENIKNPSETKKYMN